MTVKYENIDRRRQRHRGQTNCVPAQQWQYKLFASTPHQPLEHTHTHRDRAGSGGRNKLLSLLYCERSTNQRQDMDVTALTLFCKYLLQAIQDFIPNKHPQGRGVDGVRRGTTLGIHPESMRRATTVSPCDGRRSNLLYRRKPRVNRRLF